MTPCACKLCLYLTIFVHLFGISHISFGNPTLHWATPYSSNGPIYSSPAIANDGTVYIGSNDKKLHAINANGTAKWTFTAGDWIDSTPTIGSDGVIYVGSWDNQLYAINPSDGTKLWDFNTSSSIIASPSVAVDGRIYFGSKDDFFYALESNGSLAWQIYIGNPISSSAALGQDGTIYFGDENGTFHALNQDGTTKWTYVVDEVADTNKSILSSPAIDLSGNIFFGSGNGYCYSIADNGSSTSLNWKYQTSDRVDASPVLGTNNEVFFISRDGYLRSIDTSTGINNWEGFVGDVFYSSPVVDSNGRVYVIGYTGAGENHLFAYDSDGSKAWDTNNSSSPLTIGGLVDSSLALDASGNLFFGCYDHKVYAVNVGSGLADTAWPEFQRNGSRTGAWPSFSVNVIIEPEGAGEVNGTGIYNQGASATLTITSDSSNGYSFEFWGNGQTGSSNPLTLEVNSNLNLTANFGLNTYSLTVNAGTGGTATGSGNILHGNLITITATPSTGYSFTGWTGDGITDPTASTTTVNMIQARTVTANFALNTYSVNVIITPNNAGSVNGAGTYNHGDTVTLSAISNTADGYTFDYWSGSSVGSENPLTFQINSDMNITANFDLNSYTLTVNTGNGGTATGSGNISHGTHAAINASPSIGYSFTNWTGDGISDSSTASTSVHMTEARTATANFTPLQYSISSLAGNGGTVNDVNGSYPYQSNISIVATAGTGYRFTNWTQSNTGITDINSSSTTLLIDKNQAIFANFTPINYDLNVSTGSGGSISSSPPGNSQPYNSVITFNATPDSGYYFTNWSGSGIEDINSSTTTLTIAGNHSIQANFALIPNNHFILGLNSNPNFTASDLKGAGVYTANEIVEISATPQLGYTFLNWTGGTITDLNSSATSLTITEDLNLTANFTLNEHTLILSANQGGEINDVNTTQIHGASVSINAIPDTGYTFLNWEGSANIEDRFSALTNVSMLEDTNITATFKIIAYSIQISTVGNGVANGTGIYSHGDTITFLAAPSTGYNFKEWSGSGITNSNNSTLSLTITEDLNLTATFSRSSYSFNLSAGIGGSVNDVNSTQLYGELVSLNAVPDTGYRFASWEGNSTFTDRFSASTQVTLLGDANISASFAPQSYTINISTKGEGTATGAGTYNYGDTVSLLAEPTTGYYFSQWSGDGIEDSNISSLTITVSEDLNITGTFLESPHKLNETLEVKQYQANWYSNNWFGYFYQASNGWCYHFNLGWLYPESQTDGSLWIWSPQLKWIWLSSSSYSDNYGWSGNDNNWLYFDFISEAGAKIYNFKNETWSEFDKNQAISIIDILF